MKKRFLGVDYGGARIGLAVSDPMHVIASPLAIIQGSNNPIVSAKNVMTAVRKKNLDIAQIVIGLPLHLDGKESERSTEVRSFATEIEKQMNISVLLFDERLTTVQAHRLLKTAEMGRKKRCLIVDAVSSTLLLQSFLDLQGIAPQ